MKTMSDSNWDKRSTSTGAKAVEREYQKHKKRRNETGAAREQNRRKRHTKRGAMQAAARDKIRREIEQGKKKRPKICPKCGKNPGKTSNGLSNMIWDHTDGYSKDAFTKGQWLCRTCHNKKDNNHPGEKTTKGKMRTTSLKSIDKNTGDKYIKSKNESKFIDPSIDLLVESVIKNHFILREFSDIDEYNKFKNRLNSVSAKDLYSDFKSTVLSGINGFNYIKNECEKHNFDIVLRRSFKETVIDNGKEFHMRSKLVIYRSPVDDNYIIALFTDDKNMKHDRELWYGFVSRDDIDKVYKFIADNDFDGLREFLKKDEY